MENEVPEHEEPIKVEIKCPDCSNDYMILEGEKWDILNRRMAKYIRCPQCRRWMYHDA